MRVFHLMHAEYALSNIALGRLKIARIADLNDPFELLAANLGGNKPLRKAMREWRTELHKSRGLLCFSRDWYSPVLWSHYADKHRGICLGFDLRDDLAEPVKYVDQRLPTPTLVELTKAGVHESFIRELLRTKYIHWAYEREVRVFLRLDPSTLERGLFFYPFSNDLRLSEVILGPLCELPIDRVRHFVTRAHPDVHVLQSRLAFKWFNVVPRESTLQKAYVSPVDGSVVEPM
jgi:hypothetical protein